MSKNTPTAFVPSGGASLGAIQDGSAHYERGFAPDMIAGTSAGALNGAFIASRPQTVETAQALGKVWRGLRRSQIFPLNPLTGLLGFLGTRDHLVPASGPGRVIGCHVEQELLEEMPIALHVIAVDVVSGEELRLSSGPTVGRAGQRVDPGSAATRPLGGARVDGRRRGEQQPDLARGRARRAGDLRPSDPATVRAGSAAAQRARDGVARCEPADPVPSDRRYRASSRRRQADIAATILPARDPTRMHMHRHDPEALKAHNARAAKEPR